VKLSLNTHNQLVFFTFSNSITIKLIPPLNRRPWLADKLDHKELITKRETTHPVPVIDYLGTNPEFQGNSSLEVEQNLGYVHNTYSEV